MLDNQGKENAQVFDIHLLNCAHNDIAFVKYTTTGSTLVTSPLMPFPSKQACTALKVTLSL